MALLVAAFCVTHLHASRVFGRAVCQRSSAVHSYGGGLELKAFTTAASISCLTGRQVAEDFSRRATHLNFWSRLKQYAPSLFRTVFSYLWFNSFVCIATSGKAMIEYMYMCINLDRCRGTRCAMQNWRRVKSTQPRISELAAVASHTSLRLLSSFLTCHCVSRVSEFFVIALYVSLRLPSLPIMYLRYLCHGCRQEFVQGGEGHRHYSSHFWTRPWRKRKFSQF